MPPKSRRLSKQRVRDVFAHGTRVHSPLFTLIVYYTPQKSRSSCSVTVSKQIAPRATSRNTIRRRLYHILYALIPDSGAAYVLIAKKEVRNASVMEITQTLKALLDKKR